MIWNEYNSYTSEWKLHNYFGRTVCQFLIDTYLPYNSISHSVSLKRNENVYGDVYENVHTIFICNSPKLETPSNWKKDVIHPHSGILCIRGRRLDYAQWCLWLSGALLWAKVARHKSYKLYFSSYMKFKTDKTNLRWWDSYLWLLIQGGLNCKWSREMTRGHFEFDANKFDNSGEMENLSERHNQPKLIQEEITWIALFTIKFK